MASMSSAFFLDCRDAVEGFFGNPFASLETRRQLLLTLQVFELPFLNHVGYYDECLFGRLCASLSSSRWIFSSLTLEL